MRFALSKKNDKKGMDFVTRVALIKGVLRRFPEGMMVLISHWCGYVQAHRRIKGVGISREMAAHEQLDSIMRAGLIVRVNNGRCVYNTEFWQALVEVIASRPNLWQLLQSASQRVRPKVVIVDACGLLAKLPMGWGGEDIPTLPDRARQAGL